MAMQIRTLTVTRRQKYEITAEKPELFTGSVTMVGNSDYQPDIKVNLTPEQLTGIIQIVAPSIVAAVDESLSTFRGELMADAERLALPAGPVVDSTPTE